MYAFISLSQEAGSEILGKEYDFIFHSKDSEKLCFEVTVLYNDVFFFVVHDPSAQP